MSKPEKEFILELKSLGFTYKSVFDLPIWGEYLEPQIIDCILKWLPYCLQESLANGVRLCNSLLAAKQPFDPNNLIEIFEKDEYSSGILCSVGMPLAEGNTYNISEWLRNELLSKPYAFKRIALITAIPIKMGIKSKEECIDFLKLIFDKYHDIPFYLSLFKYFANKTSDVKYLQDKLVGIEEKKHRKEIFKVIKYIEERKSERIWKPVFENNNYIPQWLKKHKAL